MNDAAWKKYKTEITRRARKTHIDRISDPRQRARTIQDITLEIANKIWDERNGHKRKETENTTETEEGEDTEEKANTREKHI